MPLWTVSEKLDHATTLPKDTKSSTPRGYSILVPINFRAPSSGGRPRRPIRKSKRRKWINLYGRVTSLHLGDVADLGGEGNYATLL